TGRWFICIASLLELKFTTPVERYSWARPSWLRRERLDRSQPLWRATGGADGRNRQERILGGAVAVHRGAELVARAAVAHLQGGVIKRRHFPANPFVSERLEER